MGSLLVSSSIDSFITTTLLLVVPWLYITRRYTWKANTREQAAPALAERLRLRKQLTWFTALHSTFILYNLCVNWPADLFSFLKAPLNASSDALRSRLLSVSGVQTFPERLSMLLVRLSSSEARHAYLRFGHNVVQDCDYCHSYYDYLLYWFPKPLLEYVREIAVVGIVTVQKSGHERWRARAVTALVIAGVVEAYFVATSAIIIPQDGKDVFRWHDKLWILRQVGFLALPALIHLLPLSHPTSLLSTLEESTALAGAIVSRIQLLSVMHAVGSRDPELREASNKFWERQRNEGEAAINDPAVREMAQKLGLQVEEGGELRQKLRSGIEMLKTAIIPSQYF